MTLIPITALVVSCVSILQYFVLIWGEGKKGEDKVKTP